MQVALGHGQDDHLTYPVPSSAFYMVIKLWASCPVWLSCAKPDACYNGWDVLAWEKRQLRGNRIEIYMHGVESKFFSLLILEPELTQ